MEKMNKKIEKVLRELLGMMGVTDFSVKVDKKDRQCVLETTDGCFQLWEQKILVGKYGHGEV